MCVSVGARSAQVAGARVRMVCARVRVVGACLCGAPPLALSVGVRGLVVAILLLLLAIVAWLAASWALLLIVVLLRVACLASASIGVAVAGARVGRLRRGEGWVLGLGA